MRGRQHIGNAVGNHGICAAEFPRKAGAGALTAGERSNHRAGGRVINIGGAGRQIAAGHGGRTDIVIVERRRAAAVQRERAAGVGAAFEAAAERSGLGAIEFAALGKAEKRINRLAQICLCQLVSLIVQHIERGRIADCLFLLTDSQIDIAAVVRADCRNTLAVQRKRSRHRRLLQIVGNHLDRHIVGAVDVFVFVVGVIEHAGVLVDISRLHVGDNMITASSGVRTAFALLGKAVFLGIGAVGDIPAVELLLIEQLHRAAVPCHILLHDRSGAVVRNTVTEVERHGCFRRDRSRRRC